MQEAICKGGLSAAVLGLLCPGLGQLYNGRLKRALLVPAFSIAFIFLFRSPLILACGAASIYLLVSLAIGIWAFSIFDAFRQKKELIVSSRVLRICLYLAYFISASIVMNVLAETSRELGAADIYKIPAQSMAPTVLSGDHVVVNKRAFYEKGPSIGDVIVFRYPRDESVSYLKRVVATGRQTVEVKSKELFIDGKKIEVQRLEDPETLKAAVSADDANFLTLYSESIGSGKHFILSNDNTLLNSDFGPVQVPEGQLFVLGDNRDKSSDSRIWGMVSAEKVIGRAEFVYFSRNPESGKFRLDRIGQKIE